MINKSLDIFSRIRFRLPIIQYEEDVFTSRFREQVIKRYDLRFRRH